MLATQLTTAVGIVWAAADQVTQAVANIPPSAASTDDADVQTAITTLTTVGSQLAAAATVLQGLAPAPATGAGAAQQAAAG